MVLDPNGDFAEQVARFKDNIKRYRRNKLIYIDPTLSEEVFPIINPLDLANISTNTLDKATQQLYKTLVQSFKELEMSLTGAMQGMLYNMLHTLFRKKDSSLLDLILFVDDEQNTDLVEMGCQSSNYVIQDYFNHKFMNSNMSVTKQGLANRLNNLLASETLQKVLTGTTTIDLKKAINQKKLIVFNISKGKLGSKVAKIYGRFVLTTILNIILARADIPEQYRVPCHIYCDEYHNFTSDALQEVFAEGRKYKAYLTVATQVVGQGMTSEMQKNIFGNVNVKMIGKAGYESREMMIKQMGFQEKYIKKKRLTKYSFTKLKKGRFIVQIDTANARKIRNRKKTLGNKRSMKDHQREQLIQQQLKQYYEPASHYTKKTNTDP